MLDDLALGHGAARGVVDCDVKAGRLESFCRGALRRAYDVGYAYARGACRDRDRDGRPLLCRSGLGLGDDITHVNGVALGLLDVHREASSLEGALCIGLRLARHIRYGRGLDALRKLIGDDVPGLCGGVGRGVLCSYGAHLNIRAEDGVTRLPHEAYLSQGGLGGRGRHAREVRYRHRRGRLLALGDHDVDLGSSRLLQAGIGILV